MPEVERLHASVKPRDRSSELMIEPHLPVPASNGFQPSTLSPRPDSTDVWPWSGEAGWRSPGDDEHSPFTAAPLAPDLARWLESVRLGTVEPPEPESEALAIGESPSAEVPSGAGAAPTLADAEQPPAIAAVASPEVVQPVAAEQEALPGAEPEPAENVLEQAEAADEQVAEAAAELAAAEATEPETTAEATAVELSAWRAQMRASTSTIQTPDLGEATGAAAGLRAAGGAARARRQAASGDLTQDAQGAVSTPPEAGQPAQAPPEVHPVPAAPALVEAKSNRLLPDQRMPELVTSPRGSVPVLGERPTPPPPPPPPPVMEMQRVGPGKDAAPVSDPNQTHADEVQQAAEQPATAEAATAPADPLLIKDEPPTPPPALPPAARVAVSVVIANLMAAPQGKAERILNDARTPAYNGELINEYSTIGDDELVGLTEAVTTELRMVAHAAGVSDDELNARITDRQAELEARRAAEAAAVCEANEDETQRRQQTGQDEANATAAARESVDRNTERQTEAAAGENDPSVVRARRDRLKDAIGRGVGQQRQLYDAAVARRHRQVALVERAQQLAYQAVVQREETSVMTVEPGQQMTLAQGLEAAQVRLWGQQRERELHREVLRLTREATATGDQYKLELSTAGDEAREMIQSWADGLLSEQETWWETLLRLFRDWSVQAHAESQAWEQVRAGETKDALLMDLVFLDQETRRLGDTVDRAAIEARTDIGEEQKAVLLAYYSDGPEARNPIAAVAAGVVVRMSINRRPELLQRFERILLDKPVTDWQKLDMLAKSQNPAFSAAQITNDLYDAMHGGATGWGTDEAQLFAALTNLTPLQAATVRKAYSAIYERNLDEDIDDELSGAEYDRAKAQLEGNQALATAAELNEAMHGGLTGWGTDEDVIMAALRNKTQEERDAIEAEYLRVYGKPLRAEFDSELSGHDFDRAAALREGDTAKADAIALDQAMRGGIFGLGTDEAAIEGVYTTVRQEVIAYGAGQEPPWTTAQVDAEVRRRNMQIESSYNTRYGGDWGAGEESALRQAFQSELSGPELDLATALADYDLVKADAARIAIENQSVVYADDDVINGVLESQYTRALEDVRRDGSRQMRELEKRARAEGWDAYRLEAERRTLEREFESLARERARGNMQQLEERYDSSYRTWYGGGLRTAIELNMGGHDREKARDLMAQGGYLSPAQQIHYAVAGIGTNEDALKQALKGRTAAEIAVIRAEWERLHPGERMDDRIGSELSGRDDFDTRMLLKGLPENAEQELTQMRERAQWELNNSAASGSDVQRRILQDRLKDLEEQYQAVTSAPEGPRRTAAIARFKQRSGFVSTAVEGYRKQVDAVTDTVATVAAITAAVVVAVVLTVLTAGAAGPAIAALAASIGTSTAGLTAGVAAAAALAATVITKQAMLGGAYGGEDVGVDLAVGVVDIAAAVGTAGIGNALVRAGRAGRLATMAASKSRAARILAHGLAEGAEGLVGAFPAAVTGNVINDKNWEQGNPFANIALGTFIETGMGTALSAGMGGLGGIKAPGGPNVRPPSADLLAHRGTPEGRLAQWRAYKLENPNTSMQEFLRQFDAGAAQRLAGEDAAQQLQRRLRGELLSGLPANQRGVLAGVPIEVLSVADFARLARGLPGPSALIDVDGVARLVVREGTEPRALAAQADSLARSVVRDAQGRPVRANEVLPRDLRGRVPVAVDPNLSGNTVRVLYDIDPRTGMVANIRILTGPAATSVDIQLHARTARLMERYAGFMGRARQILDRLQTWVGLNGAPPPGSRAWEARQEVEKLPRIIQDRLEQLRSTDLSPSLRGELLDDVANLQRQLDYHEGVLRDMELEPGRGFVAAEAKVQAVVTPAPPPAPLTPTTFRGALQLHPNWQALQQTTFLDSVIRKLEAQPGLVSPEAFDRILRKGPGQGQMPGEFIGELNLLLSSMEKLAGRGEDFSGVGRILDGLASDSPTVRSGAEFMLRQANAVPTRRIATASNDSLVAAGAILRKFSLEDIDLIRAAQPGPRAADAGALKNFNTNLFNAMADLVESVEGANGATIRRLIDEAGVGATAGTTKSDIFRLRAILEAMGPGRHTPADISAAIKSQNDLADRLKNLDDKFVEGLEQDLGIVRTSNDLLPLSQVPRFRNGTDVSGEAVNKFFRNEERITAIVDTIVGSDGGIKEAHWLKLQLALRNTDLDPVLTNGIIGFYWERIRLKSLEVKFGTDNVFDQMPMTITGTTHKPRVDAVIVDSIDHDSSTVTIRLEEDKTGRAVLSDAQEALHDLVKAKPNSVQPNVTIQLPPEILSRVKDPTQVKVIIVDFDIERAPTGLPAAAQ